MLGLAQGDPERRFFTPPLKAGLGAVEWVKNPLGKGLEAYPTTFSMLRVI
jgi:hypothetical protein